MKTCRIILVLLISKSVWSQSGVARDSTAVNTSRLTIAITGSAAVWAASYIALDKAWYGDQPRSPFHFFNDIEEWQQADKGGHIWSAYQMSRVSTELWKWTGMKKQHAVLAGAASGIAYQSIIEIQDGFAPEWGFSWSDMFANVAGAATFAGQELGWKEQRIQIKYSYHAADHPPELQLRADDLFGTSLAEKLLKDYNGHTYWASTNLHSFFGGKLPKWLNMAVGYHAEGMYGGFENKWTDENGEVVDRTDIPRTRHWILSPDIDWTKISSRRKGIRALFLILNMIKFPAPAISFSGGTIRGHWMYF